MGSRRTIAPLIAGLAALSAIVPASALAGSLLSGYGGPGQGSQAILGSSLLNGPRGGGGGSQGGGGAKGGGGSQGTAGSPAVSPSSTTGSPGLGTQTVRAIKAPTVPTAHRHATKGAGRVERAGARTVPASRKVSPAAGAPARDLASSPAAAGPDPLGVSGQDLLYILLALVGLILTGALTSRIARASAAGGHG
jgi:hypothetical protein